MASTQGHKLGGKSARPENFLEQEVWGGVPPLGGEPTVNTTLAGLPEPTTMVPPVTGAEEHMNSYLSYSTYGHGLRAKITLIFIIIKVF